MSTMGIERRAALRREIVAGGWLEYRPGNRPDRPKERSSFRRIVSVDDEWVCVQGKTKQICLRFSSLGLYYYAYPADAVCQDCVQLKKHCTCTRSHELQAYAVLEAEHQALTETSRGVARSAAKALRDHGDLLRQIALELVEGAEKLEAIQ